MPDHRKFHWANRVSRRDIQRLYESQAKGMLDQELLDDIHYALYVRVSDMFEVREAQQTGRVKCRDCHAPIAEPYRMGARNKGNVLKCGKCGWETTCGEFYESYTGKSLLPGSATDIFDEYLARFAKAETATDKMLLVDWLIHQFHVMQGVPRMPVGDNVIEGTTEQVRELIETLAYGPGTRRERPRGRPGARSITTRCGCSSSRIRTARCKRSPRSLASRAGARCRRMS